MSEDLLIIHIILISTIIRLDLTNYRLLTQFVDTLEILLDSLLPVHITNIDITLLYLSSLQ